MRLPFLFAAILIAATCTPQTFIGRNFDCVRLSLNAAPMPADTLPPVAVHSEPDTAPVNIPGFHPESRQKVRVYSEGYLLAGKDSIPGAAFVGSASVQWFVVVSDTVLRVVAGDPITDRILYDQWRFVKPLPTAYDAGLGLIQQPFTMSGGGFLMFDDYTSGLRQATCQLSVNPPLLLILTGTTVWQPAATDKK